MTTTGPAVPDATRLAVDRTRLAHDRTLLAWVRTATSLISFGFTVYKFFQALQESKEIVSSQRLFGPRGFGLLMISTGLFALAIATAEHRIQMKQLQMDYPGVAVRSSLTTLLAGFISLLGILGLLAVIFRQ